MHNYCLAHEISGTEETENVIVTPNFVWAVTSGKRQQYPAKLYSLVLFLAAI